MENNLDASLYQPLHKQHNSSIFSELSINSSRFEELKQARKDRDHHVLMKM